MGEDEQPDEVVPGGDSTGGDTTGTEYTARLRRLSGAGWKQRLDVQAPYRWNLRRLLGARTVLDVGCGIGRNLVALSPDSLGVDHNPHSVARCRELGLRAETAQQFHASRHEPFDGMLAAHVVEHLPPGGEPDVLREYLPYLAAGAVVVLICPQERGFASDSTHTTFFDVEDLVALSEAVGLQVRRTLSFPFPRIAGRAFPYNESIVVSSWPGGDQESTR
ncbi:MAG: methyltransferase domain-containing protein [Mycobacteriaceae bacterium]